MTVNEISDKILDDGFGLEVYHSDSKKMIEIGECLSQWIQDGMNDYANREGTLPLPNNLMHDDDLTHWGIKGMKWGVRRTPEQLGHKKTRTRRFRDRQYEDETPQQHAARLQRESNERVAKTQAKEHAASEKRQLKADADKQKRQLKSLEKQQKMQIKAQ